MIVVVKEQAWITSERVNVQPLVQTHKLRHELPPRTSVSTQQSVRQVGGATRHVRPQSFIYACWYVQGRR